MALTQVSTGGIKDGQVHTADLADAQITAGKLHADALDRTYTLGADGSNHYTFTGEGLTGAVNDPTLYLTRGKTYRFVNGNSAGAHPFRIQTTVNGSAGTEYNTGVTNNGGAGGSTIVFEVPHAAPDVLYYQCTSHGAMGGILYVTGALADGTVTTAKLADDAVTDAKLANSINSAIAANTAKTSNATHTGDVTGSTSLTIANDAVTTAKIADDAVTADKLANSINTAIAANTAKDLTALSASNLTSGTVPDARFPAALPAVSGANLTNLPAGGKPTNLVINGAMRLAQRGTYSAGEGYKTVDRFQYYKSGTNETPNQSQVDVTPGGAYQAGFRKAYQIQNGNQSSAGGSDLVFIEHNLEARNIRNSGWNYTDSSSNITLSFWVKSSVAQNFYGQLVSTDGTSQNYPFETGSLSANTWTKITKTIPGNSNLQFDDDSNRGFQIIWWPFLGDGYTDSSVSLNSWGAWASGSRTPDNTSTWYMTNDSTFQVTGVLLEVGDTAGDFPFESPDETLRKCKRYCHVISKTGYSLLGLGMQYFSGTIFIDGGQIEMRATPTMVAKAGVSGAYNYEKVFGNSAQYHHQIGLDGKTSSEHVVFNMSGDASRQGQAVRCSAHAFSLSNNEPMVYLTAEI